MPRNSTTTQLPTTGATASLYGWYDANVDVLRMNSDNLASRNFDGIIPKFATEISLYDSNAGRFNLQPGQYFEVIDEYGVRNLRLVVQVRSDTEGNYYGAKIAVSDDGDDPSIDFSFKYPVGHPLAGTPTKVFIDYRLPSGESLTYTVITTLGSDQFPTNKVYATRERWDLRSDGSKGWLISGEGNAIFNNLSVRGNIKATSGNFEGFLTVNNGTMKIGAGINENEDDGIIIDQYNYWFTDGNFSVGGNANLGVGAPVFNGITWNGSIFTVTGDIKADTGYLGGSDGWVIESQQIKAAGINPTTNASWGDSYFLKNPNLVTSPTGAVVQFGEVFKVFKNGNVSIQGELSANSISIDTNNYWNILDSKDFRIGTATSFLEYNANLAEESLGKVVVKGEINATGGTFENTITIGTSSSGNKIRLIGGNTDATTKIAVSSRNLPLVPGFKESQTPFYVDGEGKFSLGNNLSWNPNSSLLEVNGAISGYIVGEGNSGAVTIDYSPGELSFGFHPGLTLEDDGIASSTVTGVGLGGAGIRLDSQNYWYTTANGFRVGDDTSYLWFADLDSTIRISAPVVSSGSISASRIEGGSIRGSDVFANSAQFGGTDYGWISGAGGLFSGTAKSTIYLQSGYHSNPIEKIIQDPPQRVNVTGKITASSRSKTITGVGTDFTQELRRGYGIYVISGQTRYFIGNVDEVIDDKSFLVYDFPSLDIFIKDSIFYAYKTVSTIQTQLYSGFDQPEEITTSGTQIKTTLLIQNVDAASEKYQVGDEIIFDEMIPQKGVTGILTNKVYYVKNVTGTNITLTETKQNILQDYSNNTLSIPVSFSGTARLILNSPKFSIEDSEFSGFSTFVGRVTPTSTGIGSGRITVLQAQKVVKGIGTEFLSQVKVNEVIRANINSTSTLVGTVKSIESDTSLTLYANWSGATVASPGATFTISRLRVPPNSYRIESDSVPGPVLFSRADSNQDGVIDEETTFISNTGVITYLTPGYVQKEYVENTSYLTTFTGEDETSTIEIGQIKSTTSIKPESNNEYFYNVYLYPNQKTRLNLKDFNVGDNVFIENIPLDPANINYNKLYQPLNNNYYPIIAFVNNSTPPVIVDKSDPTASGILFYGDGYLDYVDSQVLTDPQSVTYSSFEINEIVCFNNLVTLTTTEPHNFVVGQDVFVTGFRETPYLKDGFLGTYRIYEVIDTTHFSYIVVFPDTQSTTIEAEASSFPLAKVVSFDKNYSLWIGDSRPENAPISIDPYGNKLKVKDLEVTGEVIGFYSDIIELDDFSGAFNGLRNTFTPKYNYGELVLKNPLSLVVSLNGVIQSGFITGKEYVWQSGFISNKGYTIDSLGRIKFSESPPIGSNVNVRVFPGPVINKKSRIYPFKPADVALG